MKTGWLVILLVVAAPQAASARCLAACQCSGATDWVVSGVLEASGADGGAAIELRVTSVHFEAPRLDGGSPAAPAVGSRLPWRGRAGTSVLASAAGPSELIVDGGVTCDNVHFTVAEYADALSSGTCHERLTSRGHVQPPCNDRTAGCSAAAGPALVALGLLAFLLGRRRASLP